MRYLAPAFSAVVFLSCSLVCFAQGSPNKTTGTEVPPGNPNTSSTNGTEAQKPTTPAKDPATVPAKAAPSKAAPSSAVEQTAKPPSWAPGDDCITRGDAKKELGSGRNPGPAIVYDSYFVPAGGWMDFGMNSAFKEGLVYFSYIDSDDKHRRLLGRSNTVPRKATDKDNLVKKGLIEKDQTIVSVSVPESISGLWKRSDIFLYTCNKSPENVSHTSIRISPLTQSITFTVFIMVLLYLTAARTIMRKSDVGFWQSLNPIRITAGADGRGSLATFQVFFFTIIVFVLILYFVFRAGLLADISSTVLILLGIAGVGSTAAKGADAQRNSLDPANKAWLMRKGWFDIPVSQVPRTPSLYDLFTSEGEFDVYRYQSFIFSAAVGCALFFGGVTQLSSFSIPDNLLGILGLSQVVYIGGKLVTTTSVAQLNTLLTELRALEAKFRDAAVAPLPAVGGVVPAAPTTLADAIARATPAVYNAYLDKAKDASVLFKAATGLSVDSNKLEPSFGV